MSKRDDWWMKNARTLRGLKRLNHMFDWQAAHATPTPDGAAKARARRALISERNARCQARQLNIREPFDSRLDYPERHTTRSVI